MPPFLSNPSFDESKAIPSKEPVIFEGPSTNTEKAFQREMIGRADQVWNKQKRCFDYWKMRSPVSKQHKFTKYVILVRRKISGKGFPTGEIKIDIHGELLQQAIIKIHGNVKGFRLDEEPPQIDPQMMFYAYEGLKKALETKHKTDPSYKDFAFEIQAALRYIEEDFSTAFKTLAKLLPSNEITFEYLWTLFKPNVHVFGITRLGERQLYRIRSARKEEDQQGNVWLLLDAEHLESDGTKTGIVQTNLKIPFFDGSMQITDLPYYPLNFNPESEKIHEQLLARGERAIRLHGRCLIEYDGHALKERRMRDDSLSTVKFHAHGRVMLDPKVFDKVQPNNVLVPVIRREERGHHGQLSPEQITTISPHLYGFSLANKTWGAFAISNMKDVTWDKDIFESVVIDQDRKELVHDLVSAHKAGDDNGFDDVVRDKGKGLIGLLAGPPGVGKTLTAEAVAEVTERPLYMVSSGELGDTPETIHSKLSDILEIAELWEAVVLLDEADVFLTKRNDIDLLRNAIASIFLRELEYYQGILLLTTNRIKSFDSAFESRIHFCLHYRDLDSAGREEVWRTFIGKAKSNRKVTVDMDDPGIKSLAQLDLNGRQIKNIMSVSQSIAISRRESLTVESILKAIKISQGFHKSDIEVVDEIN